MLLFTSVENNMARVGNVFVDWLSRRSLMKSEWQLNLEVFNLVTRKFRRPVMDLFASHSNAQLLRFLSRDLESVVKGLDALMTK